MLGRPRCRWEDNIKMIFRKWDAEVWTEFSWLRIETGWQALVNAVMNLQVP
jgi:hypothetical protein